MSMLQSKGIKFGVITLTAILILGIVGAAVVFAGGPPKPKVSQLKNSTLIAYASTSGLGGNSGRIWSGEAKIKKLGKVNIEVKASWNLSFYNGVDHPAALVNTVTVDFEGCRSGQICAAALDTGLTPDLTQGVVPASLTNNYTNGKVRRGHPDGFRTDATVTITRQNGDEINGEVRSGSVYEIHSHSGSHHNAPAPIAGGSINEWFIGFDIVGGTGDLAGASGSGQIHMIWDSGNGYSDPCCDGNGKTSPYGSDPARFTVHELYLTLNK